ncbi:AAA family ATPase [Streptomyces sp. PTM05]|uniref:AAA family ATPase n=1 Tax=Streptantibioticus parmotrematis TaxID=2873249 RepID=A0ABS7QQ26_9ACTN|nr:LuxR family transcriptional regulator [Streptantibioticus parmotrematis]MBY8885280.1 AAA family ATPase [Streptantibioticus parmotrematis]
MPTRRGKAGRETAGDLQGRARETALLSALAGEALRGEVRVVVLSGPVGMGKTALVERAARTCGREFTVLRSTGLPAWSATPYSGLVRSTLSGTDSGGGEETGDGGSPEAFAGTLTERTTAIEAARALLGRLRPGAPLLLLLDDAHLIDAASLRALSLLMADESPPGGLLTVVATERPDAACELLGLSATTHGPRRITLQGLSTGEAAALVEAEGVRVPPEPRIASLVRWCDGNPLYLKAVLDHLALGSAEAFGEPDVPPSLTAAVARWSQTLPEPARHALRVLAVLRAPSTVPQLNQIAELPVATRDLELLARSGAVRWSERGGVPHVELVHRGQREALYRGIPLHVRQDVHRRAARALAPPERWRHQVAASDAYDAPLAERLLRAAEQESREGHFSLAARHTLDAARVAPDGADRQAALLDGVRLLIFGGETHAALRHREAVLRTPAGPLRSEALGLMSMVAGRGAAASRYLTAARQDFERSGRMACAAAAAAELAVVQNFLARGEDACASARFALAHSASESVSATAGYALALGTALTGGAAAGLAALGHLPQDPAQVATHDMETLTCRGMFRGLTGDLQGAVADLDATLYHRVVGRVPESNVTALVHCVWTHYLLGEWHQARRRLAIAFDLADEHGRGADFGILHGLSAILHTSTGRLKEAEADLEESAALSRNADYGAPAFHTTVAQAAVRFLLGDHREVVALVTALRRTTSNLPRALLYGSWFLPIVGVSYARLGRVGEARQALDALRGIAGDGPMLAMTRLWLEAAVHEAEGDQAAAVAAYRAALAVRGPGGDPRPYRALIRRDLGSCLLRTGDNDGGCAELRGAAGEFTALGAHPLRQGCEELLREATAAARVECGPRCDAIWAALTSREREIAELVGRGWTNNEIAGDLFISSKTVEYHLRNIFVKSGFPDRKRLRDWYQDTDRAS